MDAVAQWLYLVTGLLLIIGLADLFFRRCHR